MMSSQLLAVALIALVAFTGLVAGCTSQGQIADDKQAAKTVDDVSQDLETVSDQLGELDNLFEGT